MFSNEIAIQVDNVSKRFELYHTPRDRLKQLLLPRIQNFTKSMVKQYFLEFFALKNISFEVKKGESFGILGRNGSGKSTLLQIIAGTLTPTTGTIQVQGRVGALLELGSGFNPEFTGRENVYINGALLGLSQAQINDKFDAIAAFADIGIHLDQPLKTYSSGMLLRLAFAVQTQIEPEILIIDEALAVGDALFQKRCFQQLKKLLDKGCTLLFVSHDQEIVRSLTTRALFLHQGVMQKFGASSEVLFAYREFLQQQDEAIFRQIQQDERPDNIRHTEAGQSSYGNLDVEILNVSTLNTEGNTQNAFQVGDTFVIEIECLCHSDVTNLNVAFRLINKEGIKVTTWGTLNEDMVNFEEKMVDTFWSRQFRKGERFKVKFVGSCKLAANLYEVQAVVACEYDKYYANQRILHWRDDACHFTVFLKQNTYVFDGVCDIGLRSTFDWVSYES